ncbi:MAG: 50S ribosomal protein L31, partial [Fimbriimonadales bacterium]|nr:50S ribosomal protein L31 [Fimbriimonadales bacterium]
MKSGIHPRYVVATVQCACGNRFETLSTKEEIRVEVCAMCHPAFTGEGVGRRVVD